jgi:hypothetical protein
MFKNKIKGKYEAVLCRFVLVIMVVARYYACVCVCVCACVCLSYPECNAHAPYCHLWSTPLWNIFPHYLINGTVFGVWGG